MYYMYVVVKLQTSIIIVIIVFIIIIMTNRDYYYDYYNPCLEIVVLWACPPSQLTDIVYNDIVHDHARPHVAKRQCMYGFFVVVAGL